MGLGNYVTSIWYALIDPPKMPHEIVKRPNAETRLAVADPEFANGLLMPGAVPQASSPAELESFMRGEVEKWKKVIVATKVLID